MSVTLRRSVPLNIPANGVHSENDTVDFILTHEGESLELGSIRLEGELQIRNNNVRLKDLLKYFKKYEIPETMKYKLLQTCPFKEIL